MGKPWKQWQTVVLGSKITANGDCSHEIKRHLLLGRKAMPNLERVLRSREITLPRKIQLVKAMVFPVVMYRCESWTIKKAERWRIDVFELWCWIRLLRVPWTAAQQASLPFIISRSLLKLMSIESVQLSHPLSSPSSPAFNLSQHQGLFQGVSSLHQVAKVLEFQLQHQSFQWTQEWFL